MLEEHDERTRRCPPLGGPVPFKYCRTVNKKLPCQRIVMCWEIKFDVAEWLEANYSKEQLKAAFTPDDRNRLQKILQIAHDVKKEQEEKG